MSSTPDARMYARAQFARASFATAMATPGTTEASVKIAGGLMVAMGALTTTAEAAQFPPILVWIMAALTGTMAGAFAAVLVSLIVSARASARHHLLRLALAFIFGLVIAPLTALAYDPDPPKHIPIAVIWFAISGLAAFLAPAFAIVLHKRSEGIAENVIDRVSTPQQAREDRESGKARLVVIVLLGALALWVWVFWDVFVLVWLMMTTQVH